MVTPAAPPEKPGTESKFAEANGIRLHYLAAGKGESRIESLRLADIFRARVVDSTTESFVFEMTGSSEKLNAFITLMEPLGLVEVSRTGAAAISRGPASFSLARLPTA